VYDVVTRLCHFGLMFLVQSLGHSSRHVYYMLVGRWLIPQIRCHHQCVSLVVVPVDCQIGHPSLVPVPHPSWFVEFEPIAVASCPLGSVETVLCGCGLLPYRRRNLLMSLMGGVCFLAGSPKGTMLRCVVCPSMLLKIIGLAGAAPLLTTAARFDGPLTG
jgi:hypothetical protein